MEQIDGSGYVEQLRREGLRHIVKCAIACHAKNCEIIFETETTGGYPLSTEGKIEN